MENDDRVDLENTGEIDLPEFDASKYVGVDAKIAEVTEHQGSFGFYIKISTENIDKEAQFPVIATRIFGLQTVKDKEGKEKTGWGKNTKLGLYLQKKNVKHYKELAGTTVKIQTHTSKEGKDFLNFN